jgi:deazaflavin-dependent oxidoreductase (nitroreductase family)
MRIWLPLAAFVVAAMLLVRGVFTREAARQLMFPLLRPLYKHVFNPRVLHAAARGETPWGVVHHVGRRSGAMYATPIDAERTPDGGVVIPVVYGARAEWCRNILAAGQCTLTLNGQELALSEPRFMPIADIQARRAPDKARFWRSIGIEHCLSFKIATPEVEATPQQPVPAGVPRTEITA